MERYLRNCEALIPNQGQVKIQVLHLVSLRSQKATLFLASIVPCYTELTGKNPVQTARSPDFSNNEAVNESCLPASAENIAGQSGPFFQFVPQDRRYG